jgi:vacuolar-type H+-ATPase subunit E/Vma4
VAIANLLAALEREADAERAAITAAAEAEAEQVRAGAARRHDLDRQTAIAAFRAERTRRADAEVAAAARRWRGDVLAARGAALDRLRAAMAAELPAQLAGGDGPRLLDALLAAALAPLPDDAAATVSCPPALAAAVRERLAGRPTLAVTGDGDVGSGARIIVGGGALVIDATLEAQLDRHWPRLRQTALAPDREAMP